MDRKKVMNLCMKCQSKDTHLKPSMGWISRILKKVKGQMNPVCWATGDTKIKGFFLPDGR